MMLRLAGEQVESLFDEALPIEVRELPEDLARLDVLLGDPGLLEPIVARWEATARIDVVRRSRCRCLCG